MRLGCAAAVRHTSLGGTTSLTDTHLTNADRRWLYTILSLQLQVVLHWTEEAECIALDEHSVRAAVCRLDVRKEGKRSWRLNGLRGPRRWIATALYLCWLYPVSWYRLKCTSIFM